MLPKNHAQTLSLYYILYHILTFKYSVNFFSYNVIFFLTLLTVNEIMESSKGEKMKTLQIEVKDHKDRIQVFEIHTFVQGDRNLKNIIFELDHDYADFLKNINCNSFGDVTRFKSITILEG